jgi:putative sigma-54 modulation protein
VEVNVSSRNIEISDALRAAAEEKIGRLARFLGGMERAEVHLFEETNPRITDKDVCEVTLEGHGHHVRAKVAAADPFVALDSCASKLEHQLHKLKTKLQRRNHPRKVGSVHSPEEPGGLATPAGDIDHSDQSDGSVRIVRTKQFTLKPMTPEEAAMQMDLLGHDFFFFSNADSGRAGVVYRRNAGDIGLIEEAR